MKTKTIPNFTQRVSRSGNSRVFTIPAFLVSSGYIEDNEKYEILVKVIKS